MGKGDLSEEGTYISPFQGPDRRDSSGLIGEELMSASVHGAKTITKKRPPIQPAILIMFRKNMP